MVLTIQMVMYLPWKVWPDMIFFGVVVSGVGFTLCCSVVLINFAQSVEVLIYILV